MKRRQIISPRAPRKALDTTWRSRGAPEVIRSALAPSKTEGAGKAVVVRNDAHGGAQVRRNTRSSRRSGFTAYGALFPELNSSGLRRRRIGDRSSPVGPDNLHQLDTSHGCQDHAVFRITIHSIETRGSVAIIGKLGGFAVARYPSSTPRCRLQQTGDPWTAIPHRSRLNRFHLSTG